MFSSIDGRLEQQLLRSKYSALGARVRMRTLAPTLLFYCIHFYLIIISNLFTFHVLKLKCLHIDSAESLVASLLSPLLYKISCLRQLINVLFFTEPTKGRVIERCVRRRCSILLESCWRLGCLREKPPNS